MMSLSNAPVSPDIPVSGNAPKATPRRPLPWFALGIAATLMLLVFPATRQIMRFQVAGVGFLAASFLHVAPSPADTPTIPPTLGPVDACVLRAVQPFERAARTQDDDFQKRPTDAATLARFDAVYSQCGDVPAVQAILLNHLSWADVALERAEEKEFTARPGKAPERVKPVPAGVNTDAILARWMTAAEKGESLDRQNGYFPVMKAFVLLVEKRDDEAIAALHEAAQKPHFNDYSWAIADAKTHAQNASPLSAAPAIARAAIYASDLFPQYAKMRQIARMVTALAMKKEMAGNRENAFILRHDLARIGAKMRFESRTLIGSLVGIAITAIAGSRPEGIALPDTGKGNSDERTAKQMANYVAYLNRTGHADEAVWYLAERKKGDDMKRITNAGLTANDTDLRWLFASSGANLASGLLLFGAIVSLLFGAIAGWIVRGIVPGVRPRLTPVGAVGVVAGVCLTYIVGLGIGNAVFGTGGMGGYWSNRTGNSGISQFVPTLFGIFWTLGTVLSIAVPGKGKAGESDSVTRRLNHRRQVSVTRAGKFLVAYAVVTVIAGVMEVRCSAQMDRQFAHEGRYFAELTGQEWPGEVTIDQK